MSRGPQSGASQLDHPTRRPIATIAAVAAGLIAVGMLFGSAAWVIGGIATIALVLIGRSTTDYWANHMTATRQERTNGELRAGSRIDVRVAIENHGVLPVLWLLTEDLIPPRTARSYELVGRPVSVMLLWPKQTKTLEYQIIARRRGYLQIGPTVLETGDLMGLYRRFRVHGKPQYITVLPPITPLAGYDIGSRRPIGEISIRDSVHADPTRLRGIRAWQKGDPMRSVHWAATARTGELHTKVYEPSSLAGATLILDFHRRRNPARNEPVRGDLAVAAAASIAASLHDVGDPFALATNGRDAADRVAREGPREAYQVRGRASANAAMKDESDNDRLRPVIVEKGRDVVHLKEVVRTLARLELTDGLSIAELLAGYQSRLSADTTWMVILQMADEATIGALIAAARRGRAVAVIVNTHEVTDFGTIAGPLISAGIPTSHLADESAIASVCRQAVLRE